MKKLAKFKQKISHNSRGRRGMKILNIAVVLKYF